jgi:hypothetical protein
MQLEAPPRVFVQRAAGIRIDQVVFDRMKVRSESIVDDAQLVEPLGFVLAERAQEITNQQLIVTPV